MYNITVLKKKGRNYMQNKFTVISGADISGSCYLLELNGCRILFDCGSRSGAPYSDHPDIPSPETIDAIFISHAHLDHVSSLAYAAAVCKNARIFMSEQTKEFTRYQLAATIGNYIGAMTDALRFHNSLMTELVMNRIETVPLYTPLEYKTSHGIRYSFYLFDAGHVPGAIMVCLEIEGHKVMYTGDFSAFETSITSPMSFAGGFEPDTMILCGTHARRKDYSIESCNPMYEIERKLRDAYCKNRRIVIPVSQLTKGLELLSLLEGMISCGDFPKSDIYIEQNLLSLASYFEHIDVAFKFPLFSRPLSEWRSDNKAQGPTIVFEKASGDLSRYAGYTRLGVEFTLHADYFDILNVIEAASPSRLFIVHAGSGSCQPLLDEGERLGIGEIIYTENKQSYPI